MREFGIHGGRAHRDTCRDRHEPDGLGDGNSDGNGHTDRVAPTRATAGLDDLNGDGTPDPTCGNQDFGAGLVLRIPCATGGGHEPESGTTLVKDSLYRLPSADVDLTGISGEAITARDAAGTKVVIVIFNSDELFATGRDAINSTDTMDGTIQLINAHYAGSAVQVRGHTDATGSAAGNQALSERRARNVQGYLTAHKVRASSVTAAGLGSSRPLVAETSAAGQRFNRRVEIVIRLPR